MAWAVSHYNGLCYCITALFWQKQGGYFFIEITIKNVKINTTIIAMYSIIF